MAFDDENPEKPLDPAVDRVRRKMVRFMAINLGLLFTAVIAVLVAVVYKSQTSDKSAVSDVVVPAGEAFEGDIPIPAGASIVSQSVSGNRVALDVADPAGGRMIVIYDLAERRVIARLTVKPQ